MLKFHGVIECEVFICEGNHMEAEKNTFFLVTGSGDTSLWLSTRQTAFNDTDFFALFSLSSVVHLGHEASGCCPVFNLPKPR